MQKIRLLHNYVQLYLYRSTYRVKLKKLANEKMKTCNCSSENENPSKNSTAHDEEYQKICNILENSEISEYDSIDIFHKKRWTLMNVSEEIKLILIDISLECDHLHIKHYFNINPNPFKKASNSFCSNLKYDIKDISEKIFINAKEVEQKNSKTIPCLEKTRKKLENNLKGLNSNEKQLVEDFIETVKNLEQKCAQYAKDMEENAEKLIEISKEMMKVRDEKCSCKQI